MADSPRRSRSEPPPFAPTPAEPELRLPPADHLTERLVLGSVLVNPDVIDSVSALDPSCFSTEAFRRIHARMAEMQAAGTPIDRLTLMDALRRSGQLESVGGFTALVELDAGLPSLPNLDEYLKILREFAHRRQLIALGTRMAESAYSGEQTPVEIAGDAAKTWQEIESNSGQNDDGGQSPLQIVEGFLGGVSGFLDPSMQAKGLPSGFTHFDEMTGGLHGGEILLIAARPSAGKTSLAIDIIRHLTLNPRQRRRAAFFSLEMSKSSILRRLLCSHAQVDQTHFKHARLDAEERHRLQVALSEIVEANLTIYDTSGSKGTPSIVTMPEVTKRIRNMANSEGLDIAVVDYFQLLGMGAKAENRNQELSQASRQFKLLAGELNIPIILLSQLSRANEKRGDPRPVLSDLRDTGALESDADIVTFVFREELYKKDRSDLKGRAEWIISKQRNGPIGTVNLLFKGQFTRFENYEQHPQED